MEKYERDDIGLVTGLVAGAGRLLCSSAVSSTRLVLVATDVCLCLEGDRHLGIFAHPRQLVPRAQSL